MEIPRDYFVPDFGVDEDILNVNKALVVSEAQIGKTWKPVFNDDKKYWENMPAAAANSSYTYKPFALTSPEDSEATKAPN